MTKTGSLDQYAAAFAAGTERRRGAESGRVGRMRREALDRFLSLGFPTTRDEEWRFTSVAPIAAQTFRPADPGAVASPDEVVPFRFRVPFAAELVFVNGRYAPALSSTGALPAGVRAGALSAGGVDGFEAHLGGVASFDRRPFVALNTALFEDGAFVTAGPGAVLEAPIHLLFLSTAHPGGEATMGHPRVLVVLGENAQATVVETYAGPAGARYLTDAVTEIVLGDHALLDHYKLQHESHDAFHVGGIYVQAARSAHCASHSMSLGGALVRNDVVAVLGGDGGECTLNGLYLADGQRLVDNHTTIDHAMPHCGSREIYKGILADRARGVFNGKIIVRPDAQKTDAKQTNRALLLSQDAQVNSKPELEIFANDVKCTHGAAVGQLDEDALFYLRSRGLALPAARSLLIRAFAGDVLNRLPLVAVREAVETVLQRQLSLALDEAA